MSCLKVEQRGTITIITIDNAARRNVISQATAVDLQRAFADFDASDQRVAVLTSTGDEAFTAGADLGDIPEFWRCTPGAKELGVDLDIPNWYGVFAPKGTPVDVVNRLGELSREIVAGFDKKSLVNMSMGPSYQGPAEFKRQIAKDDALMREVITKANVKME